MPLPRDGFMVLKDDHGAPALYMLRSGSPYQLEISAATLKDVAAMDEGYYDVNNNLVQKIGEQP